MGGAGNLLIAQSGGATAVINGSLVGAIEAAQRSGRFGAIIGARNGIEGVLQQSFLDLGRQSSSVLARVKRTPSAALGTSRRKLDDEDADACSTSFVPTTSAPSPTLAGMTRLTRPYD